VISPLHIASVIPLALAAFVRDTFPTKPVPPSGGVSFDRLRMSTSAF
jgi:hypothetical protein